MHFFILVFSDPILFSLSFLCLFLPLSLYSTFLLGFLLFSFIACLLLYSPYSSLYPFAHLCLLLLLLLLLILFLSSCSSFLYFLPFNFLSAFSAYFSNFFFLFYFSYFALFSTFFNYLVLILDFNYC